MREMFVAWLNGVIDFLLLPFRFLYGEITGGWIDDEH